jgi:hypothetical protein
MLSYNWYKSEFEIAEYLKGDYSQHPQTGN